MSSPNPDLQSATLPSSPRTQASPAERLSRNASFALTLSLALLCLLWEGLLAPTGQGTLALKALPLLLPLPGLWRYRLYTYRWVALGVWLYVLEGLVRATSEQGLGQGLAALEVLLGCAVFVACTLQIRQRLAARAAA